MDSPFILRPIARAAPPGFPPDVAPNQIIHAAHINAIRDSVAIWPGNVDGNNKDLTNVAKMGIGTAAPLSSQLHVAQDIAGGEIARFSGSTPDNRLGMGWDASTNTSVIKSLLGAVGRPLLLNPGGGNVAINFPGSVVTPDKLNINAVAYEANQDGAIRLASAGGQWIIRLALKVDSGGIPYFALDVPGATDGTTVEALRIRYFDGLMKLPLLTSTNPGAGSKALWYDPADGNTVKYAA